MQVETSEQSTAAESDLADSLEKLRGMIALVPEDKRESLSLVRASLLTLDKAMGSKDSPGFVQALVGLARAVIDVRQKKETDALAALPVPPYDLWLPFKAASLRSSDQPSSRYTAASAVRNKRIAGEVSGLLELLNRLMPEDDSPEENAGKDEKAQARR